jgi:predicted CDP-diglyceride synthetase/phosphatidate cytidylyltransferase
MLMSALLVAAALWSRHLSSPGSGSLALLFSGIVSGIVLHEFMGLRKAEYASRVLFYSAFVILYFLIGLTLFDVFSR